jgi:hypothetical protein
VRLRRIDVVQYGWNMFDRRMQHEIFGSVANFPDSQDRFERRGLVYAASE